MKKILALFIILAGVSFGSIASASLWSFYDEQGLKLPSVEERIPLATMCGIDNYQGLEWQNLPFEECLRESQNPMSDMLGAIARPELFYSKNITRSLALGGSETTIYVSGLPNETTGYLIINPNSTDNRELIKYTGVTTTNGNHLTGVTRGLAEYGTTGTVTSDSAVTANKHRHSSGEQIIMSNGRYEQLIIDQLNGLSTTSIKGTDYNGFDFYYYPFVSSTGYTGLPTNNGDLATKYYVDTVGAGGFTAVNVSTTHATEALGTSPETVGVIVNVDQGMYGGADGNGLYQKAKTDGGILATTTGHYITTSSLVSAGVASTTAGAGLIPVASTTGKIEEDWLSDTVALNSTFFGSGVEGDVTITAGTTTTLSKDTYYNNLTVDGVLLPNGYRVFVKDTLTVNGKIQRNGNAGGIGGDGGTAAGGGGGGASGGTGSTGGILMIASKIVIVSSTGFIETKGGSGGEGGNGANGGSGSSGSTGDGGTAGIAGTALGYGSIYGGIAGTAGADGGDGSYTGNGITGDTGVAGTDTSDGIGSGSSGDGQTGGAGGAETAGVGGGTVGGAGNTTQGTVTNPIIMPYIPQWAYSLHTFASTTMDFMKGSASGPTGGGGAGGFGGTGTCGTGTGSDETGAGGGGGAGGNSGTGGIIVMIYKTLTNNGSISVAGGAGGIGGSGGTGWGTCGDGASGTDGIVGATGQTYYLSF